MNRKEFKNFISNNNGIQIILTKILTDEFDVSSIDDISISESRMAHNTYNYWIQANLNFNNNGSNNPHVITLKIDFSNNRTIPEARVKLNGNKDNERIVNLDNDFFK